MPRSVADWMVEVDQSKAATTTSASLLGRTVCLVASWQTKVDVTVFDGTVTALSYGAADEPMRMLRIVIRSSGLAWLVACAITLSGTATATAVEIELQTAADISGEAVAVAFADQ